jgi:probable HAF family extracellular repeat protein
MKDLGTLGYSQANGINTAGQVVGSASILVSGLPVTHAFLYKNGPLIDLNSLLDSSGTGWTLQGASAINNNGQIVGVGINPLGQSEGFLLKPVPLPGAVWLFGSGLLTLLGWRMRAHSRHL